MNNRPDIFSSVQNQPASGHIASSQTDHRNEFRIGRIEAPPAELPELTLETRTLPKKSPRTYRTHKDAFAEVWPELQANLETNPELQSQMLMKLLIDREPEKYSWKQLRTLQRRIKEWRAKKNSEALLD